VAGRIKTVTISTDGLRDFVVLPEGVKLILGPISMAKLVATCVSSRAMARRALDEFLKFGEAMVAIDLDKFDVLVQPRRARWSSTSSLIPRERRSPSIMEGMNMAQAKMASMEQVAALNHRIALIEQQISQVAKLAAAKMPTDTAITSLREMIGGLHFYDPGDQAKNDAWYITAPPKVDTVEPGPLPDSITHPKLATDAASVAVLAANGDLAEGILAKLSETNDKIDALVTAGRKFNAAQAKDDLHKIGTDVQTILADMDLAMPYVKADLEKLASQAANIHILFASAKV
jgi:hypothetical protein